MTFGGRAGAEAERFAAAAPEGTGAICAAAAPDGERRQRHGCGSSRWSVRELVELGRESGFDSCPQKNQRLKRPHHESRRWFFTRMTAKRRRPYHKHAVRSGEHTRGHLSPNIWAINYGANNSLTTKIFVKKVQSPPLFCLTCDTLYRIFLIVNSHTQPERIE